MITCDFIRVSDNIIQCIRCGNSLEILDDIDQFPIFPCFSFLSDPFKSNEQDMQKIKNHASELAPEALDRSDMCSDAQILERYRICGSCEFFDNNTCTKCGCLLARDSIFMSKLSWRNEECPEKKWPKILE